MGAWELECGGASRHSCSVCTGTGISPCSPTVMALRAAPCLTGPKLHPAPSLAKPSCSHCAGTCSEQGGGARSPGPSGQGLSPERAGLSSAQNMTSAEASAEGEPLLSWRWTRVTGLEKAMGWGGTNRDRQRALFRKQGDKQGALTDLCRVAPAGSEGRQCWVASPALPCSACSCPARTLQTWQCWHSHSYPAQAVQGPAHTQDLGQSSRGGDRAVWGGQ